MWHVLNEKKADSSLTLTIWNEMWSFEDSAGFVASAKGPKSIDLSRNGPQVDWHCSPHNWSTFQMRQKQQVVILNDFNVVVFSRNPEVLWKQAPANAFSLTYVWHFSYCFLWEYYSTWIGVHHHELTTGNVTLTDRLLQAGLGCWRDGQCFSLNESLYSV